VYLDIGLCPQAFRQDRRMGDKSALCEEPEPMGRITLALYGRAAPATVGNFLALVRAGALEYTTFQRVFAGEFIQAGTQGSQRYGRVGVPKDLALSGADLTEATPFKLRHSRPGTVSLALAPGVNYDDEGVRERAGYVPVGFTITTGPAPAPSLDGQNIVFGQVEGGLDVVSAIAKVPSFNPAARLKAFNMLGDALGDERASSSKKNWGMPLKAVVILGAGVV